MTVLQKKAVNPVAHLTPEDIEDIGRRLDAIRAEVVASRGERDAAYIRRVIDVQRKLELASRAVLLFSLFPPAGRHCRPVGREDPREHGDRPQRHARPVGLDA
jgi:linoleoyl-CoA desaturase